MNSLHAKQCLLWFVEQFNNYPAWGDEDEINRIRALLMDLASGKIVTCVPFSDELMNNVFEHNRDLSIPHAVRTHYEDVGFNRACKVMVATGRMAKA